MSGQFLDGPVIGPGDPGAIGGGRDWLNSITGERKTRMLDNSGWVVTHDPTAATPVVVFSASVTLTDAQIKALPTTPIQIVAAPGAGQMIVLLWAVLSCDTTAGEYSHFNNSATVSANLFASSIYFALDAANSFVDASGPVIAGRSDGGGGLLQGNQKSITTLNGVGGGLLGIDSNAYYDQGIVLPASAGVENFDLSVVGQNNSLGNFQGGHADNTMIVTALYAIVDV